MSVVLFIGLTLSVVLLWGWKILLNMRLTEDLSWSDLIDVDERLGIIATLLTLGTISLLFFSSPRFFIWLTVLTIGHLFFWVCQDLWNRSDARLLKLVQEQGKELRSLLPAILADELSPKINEMTVDALQTLLAERKYLRKCVKETHRNRNEVKRRPHLYTDDTDTRLRGIEYEISERLKKVEMHISAYQSVLGRMTADLYDAKVAGSTPEEMQKHFGGFMKRLEEETERMNIAEAEVRSLRHRQ